MADSRSLRLAKSRSYRMRVAASGGAGTAESGLIITSPAALPGGALTLNYAYQLHAQLTNAAALFGDPTSFQFQWSLIGDLPPGLQINDDGLLQGVPTESGQFTFRIGCAVLAGAGSGSPVPATDKLFSLGIAVAPVAESPEIFSTSPLEPCVVGAAYTLQLQGGGGVGALTWSITAGELPPGLDLDTDGLITGTPSGVGDLGSYTFTAQLTDGVNPVTKIFVMAVALEILPEIVILTETLPDGRQGVGYGPAQFVSAGSAPGVPVTWEVTDGALPAGTSLSLNGFLTGTPTEYGPAFSFTVTASASGALSSSKAFVVEILPPALAITVTSPATGATVGAGTTLTLAWTTGTILETPSFRLFALNAGNVGGEFAATIVEDSPGHYHADIPIPATWAAGPYYSLAVLDDVTEGYGVSGQFSVTAYTAIAITTSATIPTATKDQAMTPVQFAATGGVGTLTWSKSAGTFPTGVTITSGGLLDGTPSESGGFSFTIRAADGIGAPDDLPCTMTVLASGVIVITTSSPLPQATIGVAITAIQLAQTGGTAPTWSVTTGLAAFNAAGFSMTSGGLITGTGVATGLVSFTVTASDGVATDGIKAFTMNVVPVLAPGTAQFTFRDGTVLTIGQGCNATLVNGSTGGASPNVSPFYTLSQALNLAVNGGGSDPTAGNAPGGAPHGIKVVMTADDLDILNLGLTDSLENSSQIGPGHPIYFSALTANMPGRTVHLGSYRGVVESSPGVFELIRPNDLKHPSRSQTAIAGNKYFPSLSNHMIDGGESIHYHFSPISDPKETSLAPSAQAVADVLEIFEVNETRIAAYPLLDSLLQQHQHDPATFNVPLSPENTRKLTWCMDFDNWMTTQYAGGAQTGGPGFQCIQQRAALKNWYAGLCVHTPVDMGGNPLRLGYYGTPGFMGIQYARDPAAANAADSLAYFLAITERVISSGMLRYAPAQSSVYKNLFRDEGTQLMTNPINGAAMFCKSGYGGATMPTTYGKMEGDLAVLCAYMLRPDRPIIADAFSRRTTQLLAMTAQGWTAASAGAANPNQGLRSPGSFLRSLWWYFRAHTILGNAATAAQLKANAEYAIERMFLARDQSATCTKALGVATKCNFVPISNNYANAPLTQVFNIWTPGLPNGEEFKSLGVSEGYYLWVTKWMSDSGAYDGTATNTNPTRLADWKVMVEWYLTKNSSAVPGNANLRRVHYQCYPNMVGGGATWNGDPIVHYETETVINPNTGLPYVWPPGYPNAGEIIYPWVGAPTVTNYFHAAWLLALEPYMTAWYPGAVAPAGDTWAQSFVKLANFAFGNPGYWSGLTIPTLSYFNGHTGSNNIWPNKHLNIFCYPALG